MKIYRRTCDGSAGIAVDDARFLAANDEDEIIRLYRNGEGPGDPIAEFDFADRLRGDPDVECDIEGAAAVGDVVYWITSHGRDGAGRRRGNRRRLFATRLAVEGDAVRLTWIGRYDRLVEDLCDPECWRAAEEKRTPKIIKALAKATRLDDKRSATLAPKKKGLCIEGLAANPATGALLLGLRNPIPGGRALVIPLLNPADLVAGGAARAEFGRPARLELRGLGVRSIGFVPAIGAYLIVAGLSGEGGRSCLYRWSGSAKQKPVFDRTLPRSSTFAPEAIVTYGDGAWTQLLGDAGAREIRGVLCKDLPEDERFFTDRWIKLG